MNESRTESSLDGSLNESYESEVPDPAIMFAPSPQSFQDSLSATVPVHRDHDAIKVTSSSNFERFDQEDTYDYGLEDSADSDNRSRSNILDRLGAVDSIPNCNKVSALLSGLGFPNVQIVSSDIDPNSRLALYNVLRKYFAKGHHFQQFHFDFRGRFMGRECSHSFGRAKGSRLHPKVLLNFSLFLLLSVALLYDIVVKLFHV